MNMNLPRFSFADVKNIYCVGRNFGLHAKELGNEVPEQPLIFTKPTHALSEATGTLSFPKSLHPIHHEVEIVLWIGDTYDSGKPLEQLIAGFAVGIDFTARDLQSDLKAKGHPWVLAKGFPNSAVLAPFQVIQTTEELQHISFGLRKNGQLVQHGTPREMVFDFATIIHYIGTHLGLGPGDLIFTGTPAGVGPVQDQDVLELLLNGTVQGTCTVHMI
jgi:fumarylpyruvate hydrolase